MTDQQAIARLKRGDVRGLETLVLRYQLEAVRTAYAIVRDAALAEDVVQTAFVRLVERIKQFEEERPFAPWFMRIVARDAIMILRRQAHDISLDTSDEGLTDSPEHLDPDAEMALQQAQTSAELWNLLETLPPEQRAVIVLHYYADLRHAEIAQKLDVPAGTIRWRLHAALKYLRRMLLHTPLSER